MNLFKLNRVCKFFSYCANFVPIEFLDLYTVRIFFGLCKLCENCANCAHKMNRTKNKAMCGSFVRISCSF